MKALFWLVASLTLVTNIYGADYNNVWREAEALFSQARYAEALEKYRLVAEETAFQNAQSRIGWIYLNGLGVKTDYRQAARWFTMAASQGNAVAQNNLSVIYSTGGYGLEKNEKAAIMWLKKAAESDPTAQSNLAKSYYEGEGVEKNEYMAYDLASKSAAQGDYYGKSVLAQFYLEGVGVPKDSKRAASLYRDVAHLDSDEPHLLRIRQHAQKKLGDLFSDGEGVTKNVKTAYKWYLLASSGSDKYVTADANVALDYLSIHSGITERERMDIQDSINLEGTRLSVYEKEEFLLKALQEDNQETILILAQELASANNPLGQYVMGAANLFGNYGIEKDRDEAFVYFKRACRRNFFKACLFQAHLYLDRGQKDLANKMADYLYKNLPDDDTDTKLLLADLLNDIGEFVRAEIRVREVLISQPDNEQAEELLKRIRKAKKAEINRQ